MFGLVVVSLYAFMSMIVLIPAVPVYKYDRQVLDHQYLPPSLTKTAGELMINRRIELIGRLMEKEKRTEMKDNYLQLIEKLGGEGASAKTAEHIFTYMR